VRETKLDVRTQAHHLAPLAGRGLLVFADALWVYGTLALAGFVRSGTWAWPHELLSPSLAVLVSLIYVSATAWSGGYRRPHALRFPQFVRITGALIGAFLLSIAGAYLITPTHSVPRGIASVHALLSIVGLLGIRSGLRLVTERLHAGRPTTPAVQREPVRLNEFVDRPPVEIDTARLQEMLTDETVLVTGAGGSIGTELCEQLVRLDPDRLILVDMCEYNLYRLQNRLERRRHSVDIEFSITDVRNRNATDRLFRRHAPGVVIHTAAYKHVPMMERHPDAAFENNTMTTAHLVDLCDTSGVDQFVFVSTDKAVEPQSVLGATKRLAEWYVRSASTETRCKIVRFGNVFGSQGSVVPLFEQRLKAGEPLPVTHPDMERYFMTAHEACSLILQTLLHDTHPVYLLRMGEPVRIEWLARQMVQAYYPDVVADRMIEYIGKRPGEKLSERLITPSERMEESDHPNILGIHGRPPCSRSELQHRFESFQQLSMNPDARIHALHEHLFDVARIPSGDGQVSGAPSPSPPRARG
jgi:FlaA1/EpsC-like NDP-sugar epimerase